MKRLFVLTAVSSSLLALLLGCPRQLQSPTPFRIGTA